MSGLEERLEDLEARVAALERRIGSGRAGDDDLQALKREFSRPAGRTAEDVAKALSIVGIGAGPSDLSGNLRKYCPAFAFDSHFREAGRQSGLETVPDIDEVADV